MGRPDLRKGLHSPTVTALRRLLDTGHVWVKLSSADRIAITPPDLTDAAALTHLLFRTAPERAVSGSDFPPPKHPRLLRRRWRPRRPPHHHRPLTSRPDPPPGGQPDRCFDFDFGRGPVPVIGSDPLVGCDAA